ncbi:glycosyltransferase family 32 protein [Suillus weaverae]|nr:glycosyltransferase family 32 protein [Suillus weaverae]
MAKRRAIYILLIVLALVLFGTVVVLSSISYYLYINGAAYLSDREVPVLGNTTRWNATEHGKHEKIPRIIHQTWKSETLPADWKRLSEACRNMMSDYDYMLWTDASSREFIAEHYSWFLDTFDNYEFTIQRADAIRYFVLYHYGGIYLDLDVGCLRPLDPLLVFPVILPKTIPVGVSNDLMFAEQGHPFLSQTIHNLVTFDHSWILNYPTVMFSTGPMFLSIQYSLYTASHPITPYEPGDVRILPKSLYGKNAQPEEAPHSFFAHYYGSSWHADDAALIGFLSTWGKGLMWLGLAILVYGIYKLAVPSKQRKYSLRRIGGYDVLLPRWTQRNGRWHIDMRWSFLPASGASTQPSSPVNSAPQSPLDEHVSLLPLPFELRPDSPAPSDISSSMDIFPTSSYRPPSSILDAVRRVRDRATGYLNLSREPPALPRAPSRNRRQRSRGVMFFLPAIFTQSQNMDISPRSPPPQPSSGRNLPPSSQLPPEKLWQGAESRVGDESAEFHQGCSQSPRPPLENRLPHSSSSPLIDLEQQNS